MPFVSRAQQRALEAKAGRGEISQAKIREFEQATKAQPGGFAALPERVKSTAAKRTKKGKGVKKRRS